MQGKAVVCVTSDGLTVDERPGEVFSFSEAALSPWTIGNVELVQGTALHLRAGRHRFVLGGVDHRVEAGTRLEAPPEDVMPDAWLPASDFDELLAIIALRCGWDVRRPAGERIRCLLIPNTSKGWDAADLPWQDFVRRRRHKEMSRLAIDVGNGDLGGRSEHECGDGVSVGWAGDRDAERLQRSHVRDFGSDRECPLCH